MAKSEESRFVEVLSEGSMMSTQRTILVDKKTGVNYLWVHDGYKGGLTVMLDADGKPIVTPQQ